MPDDLFYISDKKQIKLSKVSNKANLELLDKSDRAIEKLENFADSLNINLDISQPERIINTSLTTPTAKGGAEVSFEQEVKKFLSLDEVYAIREVYTEGEWGHELISTGEIILKFKKNIEEEQKNNLIKSNNCTIARYLEDSFETLVIKVLSDKEDATVKVANSLGLNESVIYATPNFLQKFRQFDTEINALLFSKQWYLNNPNFSSDGFRTDINILAAWDELGGFGSPEIKIGIFDKGTDIGHPNLIQNVIKQDCWNFTDDDGAQTHNVTSTTDHHGSACAGIACASIIEEGVVGVAPNCKLVAIKFPESATPEFYGEVLKYIANKCDVLSCSWGVPEDDHVRDVLNSLGKNTPIVFAAGNEGNNKISFPARLSSVIAVGASTYKNEHASYSNQGEGLDLVAPSSDEIVGGEKRIYAVDAREDYGRATTQDGNDGNYLIPDKTFGGTSASAPQVAGVIALMLSANPNLSVDQIKSILRDSSDKINNTKVIYSNGWNPKFGYGRLNAFQAIFQAKGQMEDQLI